MMLYTAVEGHHPLRRGNTLATLAAVLNDDVPPPVRAGALGDVLMSVLVRDPAARPSSAVLDRRLAEIESGSAGLVTAWQQPTAPYPLNPPSAGAAPSYSGAFAPHTAPLAGAPAPASAAGPGGFGPPPVLAGPGQPVTSPVRAGRRSRPGLRVLLGVSGTSLAGAVVLMWWLLPVGGGSGRWGAAGGRGGC